MAAKRQDAVLVVDNDGELTGILTDKDLAYRVIASRLNPKTTPIVAVMTKNPVSVGPDTTASDALNKMVAGHFRHLPVVDDGINDLDDQLTNLESLRSADILRSVCTDSGDFPTTTFAILDITKCLYEALEKLERAFDPHLPADIINHPNALDSFQLSIQQPDKHIITDPDLETTPLIQFTRNIQTQLACPTLESVLPKDAPSSTPMLSKNCSVLDAVVKMQQTHETAVLAFEPLPNQPMVASSLLAGIFTTKDLVLRVLAAGLNPEKTAISRVMTPHPDCVGLDTTVIDALRKMYLHRYLHLPVLLDNGDVCGMADVLSLTYNLLAEIAQVEGCCNSADGPFVELVLGSCISRTATQTCQSIYTITGIVVPMRHRRSVGGGIMTWEDDRESIIPDDSASAIHPTRLSSLGHSAPLQEFIYKFRNTQSKKTHRFNFSSCDLDGLCALVQTLLDRDAHNETNVSIPHERIHLCYIDDEGDAIHLSSSRDLEDAVIMAKSLQWKRLVLETVHTDSTVMDSGYTASYSLQPKIDNHLTMALMKSTSNATAPTPQCQSKTTPSISETKRQILKSKGSFQQYIQLYFGLARFQPIQDVEAVAPLVLASGVVIATAFLLGRAFR
ncbi:hypothetical protein BDEG_27096 [Batrachochytrium dendrobatidis JEL423]|uniref:CBS domain-containing protein n=1 Tax=Batrachochytrium dendrobatidis (strain JEL423) TaxID=403673 RepID=A0A177WV55_BATDL|nr:hypothetical protein BDEG_27096 [Batrachochytrium dendrobatidis JEL423]